LDDADPLVAYAAAKGCGQLGHPLLPVKLHELGARLLLHEWTPKTTEQRDWLATERLHHEVREFVSALGSGTATLTTSPLFFEKIQKLLEAKAQQMERDDLEALSRVPSSVAWECIDHIDDYSSEARWSRGEYDCSDIIRLARQELGRRNVLP
jgi:hypothetical protein